MFHIFQSFYVSYVCGILMTRAQNRSGHILQYPIL
jgi:hypothetical protein